MKKILCILLSVFIVASLITISVSAIDVPDSATPLSVPFVLRFVTSQNPHTYWYSVPQSPYLSEWQDGTVADSSPIIYPSVIFKGDHQVQDYHLRDTTTYYIQYELYSDDYVYGMSTNASFYKLVPEEYISAIFGQYNLETASQVHNPEEYDLPRISDVAREVSTEVTQVGGHTFRVSFAFSTKAGVEESEYQAIMFSSIGALEDGGNLMLKEFYAWTDENLSIYEDLVAGKLDGILGAVTDLGNDINDAADQAHDDAEDIKDGISGITGALDDVKDTLVGEPIEDNTGFSEELIELKEVEDSIQDAVFNNMNIDGTSIAIDGDVLTNIKHYLVNKFNPQDYEAVAGVQITRVFEAFMPYMGIVVWFNLALGLALGFIRGRTHA